MPHLITRAAAVSDTEGQYAMNAARLLQLGNASDEELLAYALESPDAFEILLTRYQSAFLRKAESVLRSRDDAEDAVQDAFVRIYRFADKFAQTEGASFKSWGYKILMNVIFTRYANKKKERSRTAALDPEDYERLPDTQNFVADTEMREYVTSVLEKVSAEVRQLLTLYYLEGKTQDEIATQLHTTPGAIKIRMFRARQHFKAAHDIYAQ